MRYKYTNKTGFTVGLYTKEIMLVSVPPHSTESIESDPDLSLVVAYWPAGASLPKILERGRAKELCRKA